MVIYGSIFSLTRYSLSIKNGFHIKYQKVEGHSNKTHNTVYKVRCSQCGNVSQNLLTVCNNVDDTFEISRLPIDQLATVKNERIIDYCVVLIVSSTLLRTAHAIYRVFN